MPRAPTLSKSRFTYGLQCHKQLWWRCFDGRAPELVPSPTQKAVFNRGHRVGDLAQSYVPGGFRVPYDGRQKKKAIAATAQALDAGETILYEAAFAFEEVFVAVDILVRDEHGWTLIEVKSATSVKEQYIPDAAVQAWVVRASGLPVVRIELMHLNRACRYPGLEDLFRRADITERVEEFIPQVPAELRAQRPCSICRFPSSTRERIVSDLMSVHFSDAARSQTPRDIFPSFTASGGQVLQTGSMLDKRPFSTCARIKSPERRSGHGNTRLLRSAAWSAHPDCRR